MNLAVVTWPTEAEILALLSVSDLKANMRITHSAEEDIFKSCILGAYDWLANPMTGWLNRSILTTEYRLSLPGFVREQVYSNQDSGGPAVRLIPTTALIMPKPPLISVQSLTYLSDGVDETLSSASYNVVVSSMFGTLSLKSGSTWPATIDTAPEAVKISYTAGYGNAAAVKVKAFGIVEAMKLLAGDRYRNREDTYAEPRLVAVNRKIRNGVQFYAGRYRIVNKHA